MERLIPLFRYYLLALAAVMSSEAAAVCSQTTTPSVTSTIQYACSKCQKGIPIQGTQTETGRKYLLRCALTLDLCVERSGGTHLHEHEFANKFRHCGFAAGGWQRGDRQSPSPISISLQSHLVAVRTTGWQWQWQQDSLLFIQLNRMTREGDVSMATPSMAPGSPHMQLIQLCVGSYDGN
jgi:hypothetical protein